MVLEDKEGGKSYLVAGVHLPSNKFKTKREKVIESLMDYIEEVEQKGRSTGRDGIDSVLIAGDFNMKPSALAAAFAKHGGSRLSLVFDNDDEVTSKRGVIDNILYSDDLGLAGKRVVQNLDCFKSHKPIWADMGCYADDFHHDGYDSSSDYTDYSDYSD
jgi:hypothetical protein